MLPSLVSVAVVNGIAYTPCFCSNFACARYHYYYCDGNNCCWFFCVLCLITTKEQRRKQTRIQSNKKRQTYLCSLWTKVLVLALAGEGGCSEVMEPLGDDGWEPEAEGEDGELVVWSG
jgi:hypothetical protein